MALMYSTTSGLAGIPYTSQIPASLDMVPVYMKKKLLETINRKLVFYKIADKEDLPEGNGRVVRFLRYEKLALPQAYLLEGTTPTQLRELTTTAVEAVVDQIGDVLGITDVADKILFHKALTIGVDRLNDQAAETVDREIQKVLLAGTTNLFYGGSATARGNITSSDILSTDTLRRVVAGMRDAGVPDFNGDYIGVVDPYVEQDLTRDPTYITQATQQNLPTLFGGSINPPRWMGIRWMVSNHMPTITAATLSVSGAGGSAPSGNTAALAPFVTPDSLVGVPLFYVITEVGPTGFETIIGTATSSTTLTTGQIWGATTPAATGNALYCNVYVGISSGACKLALEGVPPSTAFFVCKSIGTAAYALMAAGTIYAGAYNVNARQAPLPPSGGTINVHNSYIFGKEAYGVVNLSNIETFLTPNAASDSDPLKQRRKASWKAMFKPVVKNPNFYRRIESESGYGSNSLTFGISS